MWPVECGCSLFVQAVVQADACKDDPGVKGSRSWCQAATMRCRRVQSRWLEPWQQLGVA